MLDSIFSSPSFGYCELPANGIIARPGYAISNAAIIFVGFLLLNKQGNLAKRFGYLALLAGIMSLLYDVTYTFINQTFDILAMLLLAMYILNLNLKKLEVKVRINTYVEAIVILLGVISMFIFKGMTGNILFITIITAILITEMMFASKHPKSQVNYSYWIIPSGIMLVGLFAWYIDYSGIWCDSRNILNGRGIYHYLASISIYFYYLFYKQFERKFNLLH